MRVSRPLLRWLGGKYRLAPWIIAHFPAHRIYVEPFGGAASVLLQKDRAYNEIWNDLDGELVNLMRVMAGAGFDKLSHRLRFTPYARREYLDAFVPSDDPVERAARMLIRSHMGHGTGGARMDRQTGFRSDGMSGTTNVAGKWADLPDALLAIRDRIMGVGLEQVPAADLISRYDDEKALIFADPPYLPGTRSQSRKAGESYHTYQHELDEDDHRRLTAQLRASRSMIVLSGYPSPLYDEALPGWTRIERAARAHRNAPRTECIWLNPLVMARLNIGPLFGVAA